MIYVTTWMLTGLLGGCGSAPTAPDPVRVSGAWEATFEGVVQGAGTTQHDDFTMELTQSGTAVSGFLCFGFESIEVPITAGRINGRRPGYSYKTTLKLGIPCLIHLTHAAFADLGGDGIRAECRE